jgi:diadenosine tetraphosphate (Ap4A) HIT family hydrolase
MSSAEAEQQAPASWALHPQLAADCAMIADLGLCRLLLMRDANYPWLILVPRRPGATELIDLDDADRARLMDEITQVGRALRAVTACDKLNVAALGNAVPQLHVHVIARFRSDAAWPAPVWGHTPPQPYEPGIAEYFAQAVAAALASAGGPLSHSGKAE